MQRSKSVRTWCALTVFLLPHLAWSAKESRATGYSVKGRFVYQVYALQKDGKLEEREPLHREFEVLVNDCSWQVRIVLVGNTNFESFTYSYDGTNFVHYSLLPGGKGSAGLIDASPVPVSVTSAGGEYPWLALASACYFSGRNTNTMLSFERLMSSTGLSQRYKIPCRVALSLGAPHLPSEIHYVRTNRSFFLKEDGVLGSTPLPESFGTNGYMGAELRSGGFTNVNGLTFPTQFEYRRFRATTATTTNDLRCTVVVSGMVTNISTVAPRWDASLPHLMVQDLRVPEPNVLYRITNGLVPATNSAVVEDARQRVIKRPQRQAQRQPPF